jgi:DNA-binding beta-propeller fold protein YncE
MKKTAVIAAILLMLIPLSFLCAEEGYHILKILPLGGEGGWDYLAVDSAGKRLYVSRGTHVMVVDLETGKAAGDIPDTQGVHGIALAPELGRGFTSNGKANTATIFDLKTLKPLLQVKTGENPDAILYDQFSRRVFVFNGKSYDVTVFEAATGKVCGTVGLGGKPEFAAADGNGRVFVNDEDVSIINVIDSKTLAIAGRFSLFPGLEPTGLAYDPSHNRLFAACRSRQLVILDAADGRYLADVPIGANTDAAVFDQVTQTAFSSNGDGTLTVARETSPGKFRVVQTVATQPGARTMALDPVTHRIYLSAKVNDAFVILVVGNRE